MNPNFLTLPKNLPPVIGTAADVQRLAVEKEADLIVLSLSERRGQMPLKELLNLKFLGVQVEEAHSMYERVSGRILLDQLSPSWLILSERVPEVTSTAGVEASELTLCFRSACS